MIGLEKDTCIDPEMMDFDCEMEIEPSLAEDASEMFNLDPQDFRECPACKRSISGLVHHEDGYWRCPFCHCRADTRVVIEVVAIDNGDTPPEVSMAWVGLYLVANRNDCPILDKWGFWTKNDKPYWVWMDISVQALGSVSSYAYSWYVSRYPKLEGRIFFKKWEVREVGGFTEIDPTTRLSLENIQDVVMGQETCLLGTDFSKAYANF